MAVRIEKKIKGYAVVTPEDKAAAVKAEAVSRAQVEAELPVADVIQMHERIERPEVLIGSTYLSLIHISEPRDRTRSRMPSSA